MAHSVILFVLGVILFPYLFLLEDPTGRTNYLSKPLKAWFSTRKGMLNPLTNTGFPVNLYVIYLFIGPILTIIFMNISKLYL